MIKRCGEKKQQQLLASYLHMKNKQIKKQESTRTRDATRARRISNVELLSHLVGSQAQYFANQLGTSSFNKCNKAAPSESLSKP